MEYDWPAVRESLSRITVISNPGNEPVSLFGEGDGLRCVGIGTDAAVFQTNLAPSYAFKVYAEDKTSKIGTEAEVYGILGESSYFSTCFSATDHYLVLSYEEGPTLFDCLLQGIHVPQQAIADVEEARKYVLEKGLNPRDIHLKNILLQDGRAKIIDVSEYVLPGDDQRWEHLKNAYEEYYHLLDGRPVPSWILEAIRKWYHQRRRYFSSFEEFKKFVLKYMTIKK
ncbi:serine/threonine protein kinase [Virgibacillus xinjiangensis]|uniref:Serine/threonine protein kinase n=1 Tax=Virgibacillus xinjiangensis TaxID=393090 RepID=A0ABV7CY02_9BACI